MKSSAELMHDASLRVIKKSILVSGRNVDYWLYPASTAKSSTAQNVLMLHGYRGDHHGLEAFSGGLTDYNVYAPDLPGFGSSSPLLVEHNLDNYIDWTNEFIKAIGLKSPIAIGHSFGTLIAAGVEAKFSSFSALICINPVAGGVTSGLSKFLLELVKGYYWIAHVLPQRAGLRMMKARILVDSMSSYTTKSKDKELRKWIKNQHKMHFNSFANSRVVWECYIASIDNTMVTYIEDIKKPLLLIAAELDEITPVSTVHALATQVAGAQVYEVKNCGHLVHYETSEECVSEMNRFMGSL